MGRAEKKTRTRADEPEIDWPSFLMRKAQPERRYHGTVNEPIDIRLTVRRISRVEILGSDFGKYNAHIAGQISVDRVTQLERRYLALELDAGDLSFRVHTGVGST